MGTMWVVFGLCILILTGAGAYYAGSFNKGTVSIRQRIDEVEERCESAFRNAERARTDAETASEHARSAKGSNKPLRTGRLENPRKPGSGNSSPSSSQGNSGRSPAICPADINPATPILTPTSQPKPGAQASGGSQARRGRVYEPPADELPGTMERVSQPATVQIGGARFPSSLGPQVRAAIQRMTCAAVAATTRSMGLSARIQLMVEPGRRTQSSWLRLRRT